jgi:hypothetical protein
MITFALGSAVIGALLGATFRFFALIPATLLGLALTVVLELAAGIGALGILLTSVAVAVSLQAGYLCGAALRTLLVARHNKAIPLAEAPVPLFENAPIRGSASQ